MTGCPNEQGQSTVSGEERRGWSVWLVSLAVSLLTVPMVAVGKPSAKTTPTEAEAGEVERLQKTVERVAESLKKLRGRSSRPGPRTPKQVLSEIEGEPTAERVFAWVAAEIEFEPYRAALRGPEEVLATGAANGVDQARLLSALFEEAGLDHRFVRGSIHDPDAIEVLRRFAGSISVDDPAGVEANGLLSPDAAFTAPSYRRMVREHVWLEVAAGEEGAFVPVDPVTSRTFGQTRAEPDSRSDRLPDVFRTRMRLTVEADFSDGQHKRLVTIDGPMARFAYRPIELTFDASDTQTNTVRPEVTVGGQAKTGQKFLPSKLERLSIDYRANFGQHERKFRKELFERLGSGERVFRHRGTSATMIVIPGWLAPEWAARRVAGAVDGKLSALRSRLAGEDARMDAETIRRVASTTGVVSGFLYAYHLDAMTGNLADATGVRPVLNEPRIVHSIVAPGDGRMDVELEVLGGQLEVVPRQGVSERAVRAFTSVHGYAETRMRRAIFSRMTGRDAVSVQRIFRRVRQQKVPVATIHPGNLKMIERLKVDAEVRRRIRRDVVEGGRVVLAPGKPVELEGRPRYAWWSVEPSGGFVRGRFDGLRVGFFGPTDRVVDAEVGREAASQLEGAARLLAMSFSRTVGYSNVVCKSLSQLRRVSRSLCATSSPKPLPDVSACGADGDDSEDDGSDKIGIIAMHKQTCDQRVREVRCGASTATAFLKRRVPFQIAESDEVGTPRGLPGHGIKLDPRPLSCR